MYNFIHLDKIF